jgi:hypothetical protein
MRPGQNKRGRNRGNGMNGGGGGGGGGGNPNNPNRPRPPHRMQTFESSGPSVKIRGNAYQVFERYIALAREAVSSGDRVAAENFYQHAEHYFRTMNANGDGHQNQYGQRSMMTPADNGDLGPELDGEPGDTASAGPMPPPPPSENEPPQQQ